jgi:uncharacterized protein DUF5317
VKKFLAFARASLLWMLILPYALVFTGAASNQMVLIANHDEFPVMLNPVHLSHLIDSQEDIDRVTATGMIDDTHCVMTKYTHLNALADVFDFHDAIYSIGDGLLMAGYSLQGPLFVAWLALVLYREKQRLQ